MILTEDSGPWASLGTHSPGQDLGPSTCSLCDFGQTTCPRDPHLQNGKSNSTYFVGSPWELKQNICTKGTVLRSGLSFCAS